MAATDDRTFAGSIPEIYDRYLAPLIFDSYALDLASEFSDLSVDAVDHRSKASSPHDPARTVRAVALCPCKCHPRACPSGSRTGMCRRHWHLGICRCPR